MNIQTVIHRRHLLGLGAGALGASFFPTASMALPSDQRRLVIVVMRGGLDGLGALAPVGEGRYAELRGPLAFRPEDGAIALDSMFSLSPSLSALKPLWDSREIAFIPAVASPYRDRSHFEAQAVLESGAPGMTPLLSGWLNRALAGLGVPDPAFALAIAPILPLILSGNIRVSNWAPAGQIMPDDDFLDRVAHIYANSPDLADALRRGRQVHRMADSAEVMDSAATGGMMSPGDPSTRPKASKPPPVRQASNFAQLAHAASELIAGPHGARLTVFDLSGFDTHADQGTATGRLAPRLKDLADGLMAIRQTLGPIWQQTAVICVSEFGRTVRSNGTNGTDHGTGGLAILAGGAVKGGRILGDWPGLGTASLYEDRDLRPTTDLRSVFKSALSEMLDVPSAHLTREVFPDSPSAPPIAGLFSV